MERPSHIIFDTSTHTVSRRLPFLSLALCFQAAVFWLFTHGLMGHFIPTVPDPFKLIPIKESHPPPLPPTNPHIPKKIDGPHVPPPSFREENRPPPGPGSSTPPTPENPPTVPGVDRAPVSNLSTHTVPPYPPVARRIGAEGKVTLRLTVTAEGRVNQADVVTSSGDEDLDQAARHWIVAHWTYRPALKDGVPAISHTLATVIFSLVNDR